MPKYRTLKQLESSLVENMEMYVHYYELSDTIFNKTRKTKRFFVVLPLPYWQQGGDDDWLRSLC